MIAIPQSVTRRIPLKAYLSTDHVSAATGKTIAVVLSKNGAAFANPSGGATNATEIANGWYYVDLSTTDTGSTGPLIIRGTSSGVDDVETYRYVADAHNGGFDGVPSAVAGATNGLPLAVDSSGRVDVLKINGTSQTARDLGASVLLSAGTGTGQLDFTSGVVKANATQLLGGTIPAPNVTGVPLVDLKYTLGTISPATAGSVRADSVTGAVGSVTAAVSVTGDLSATMKTSVTTACTASTPTAAAVTGAVGSVTAAVSVTGDLSATMKTSVTTACTASTPTAAAVTGAVGSVTAGVTVSTNNDKTGYGLSAAAVQAIWDALTSALTTAGSIGKLLVTNIDALISSRSTYAGADTPGTTTLLTNVAALPTATANADALLKRDMSAVSGEAARSPLNALRFLRNKWSVSGGTLTVTKEDDTTSAWTGVVSTDPAAVPITGNDPA